MDGAIPAQRDARASSAVFGPARSAAPLSQSIIVGLMVLAEAVLIAGSGLLIYSVYLGGQDQGPSLYVVATTLYTLLMLQSFQIAGLYRFSRILEPFGAVLRQTALMLLVFLLLVACAFALKISAQFSRVWAFTYISSLLVLLPAGRVLMWDFVRRQAAAGQLARNIVVYGAGSQGGSLLHHITGLHEPWNRVVGVFDERTTRLGKGPGANVTGNLEDLVRLGRSCRVDEVLIALPWSARDRILGIVERLREMPSNVRLAPEFIGADLLSRKTTYQFGIPMLSVLERPVSGWAGFWKSVLDFALGMIFMLLAAPIMLLVALAIKLESPGPLLFKQMRYGFNNQLIGVYKFRSMYIDQQDDKAEKLTARDDPRVTRVGRFIRRFSLDELPQLFNVLKGEMSVVGPRPHALQAKAGGRLYEDVINEYAVRHKVKPGITGWAQVNGWRGETDVEEKIIKRVEHDLYYISHWSLALDIEILLRTFKVVLKGDNAY